jgi:hypothetical protein
MEFKELISIAGYGIETIGVVVIIVKSRKDLPMAYFGASSDARSSSAWNFSLPGISFAR